MYSGAITANIDVAQVVLYMFWVFFAGLIYYLHRENKREGYPLESSSDIGRHRYEGFPSTPDPKTFTLANGEVWLAPGPNSAIQPLQGGEATSRVPGSPIVPIGNPMLAGVGPGAYAQRADVPDLTLEGDLRIVPLRDAPGYDVAHQDPDPRGMQVLGADDKVGGIVVDLWVDKSEAIFRYIEVEVDAPAGKRRVLLPMNFARVSRRFVKARSILADHFADVPGLRQPGRITRLEEEKVSAYYGAGTLYATPGRQEPLL
ncbi:MAG: photosynthetic reaction center subunit H [Pseudomonadota bacterium]